MLIIIATRHSCETGVKNKSHPILISEKILLKRTQIYFQTFTYLFIYFTLAFSLDKTLTSEFKPHAEFLNSNFYLARNEKLRFFILPCQQAPLPKKDHRV